MQNLKESLLKQHIIWITNQEECDCVNTLLRLDYKILYNGSRGWTILQFSNLLINIEDIVKIKEIQSISINSRSIFLDKTYIPICLCNNLILNMNE